MANISHFTQTVNGVSTTYDIHDANAIPRSGGAVINGSLLPSVDSTYDLGSSSYKFKGLYSPYLYGSNTLALQLFCNTSTSDGSYIQVGSEWVKLGMANDVCYLNLASDGIMGFKGVRFIPTYDNNTDLGSSSSRWQTVYVATGTINTSDSRLKNSVKDINDALLDAWGNIEPKQYKFNDATEKKGEKARYHTGYLAQDIQAECEKQGVNASDYGLFCYDEWEEQEEESEEIETEKDGKKVKEKRIIQPRREKGNSYALRYEEALVVECKYLRRCIARLTARIEELEKGNK